MKTSRIRWFLLVLFGAVVLGGAAGVLFGSHPGRWAGLLIVGFMGWLCLLPD